MNDKYYFKFKNKLIEIDYSWKGLFDSLREEIIEIEYYIGDNFTPSAENIFKIFKIPVAEIKVVLLGQDPYPQEGIATGRAFEVSDYKDWSIKTSNTSLTNILKALYIENQKLNNDSIDINLVRRDIQYEKFKINSPNKIFSVWESNGVFLLNTSLTCEINTPNSHKLFWSCFTKKVIQFISKLDQDIHWLLLGNEAHYFIPIIEKHSKNYFETHPHPVNTNSFLNSKPFKKLIDFFV